jgi:hypothetical protein
MTRLLYPLLLAAALAGCGGGASIGLGFGDDDGDPFFYRGQRTSNRSGAVTISQAAPDPRLNGLFSASDVQLSDVLRFRADGTLPQTCRFRFSNLQQTSGQVSGIFGEVRYLPDSTVVSEVLLNVASQEFRQDGSAARVDRAGNQVVFEGLRFVSTERTGQVFVLTGTIPIRTDFRDPGC